MNGWFELPVGRRSQCGALTDYFFASPLIYPMFFRAVGWQTHRAIQPYSVANALQAVCILGRGPSVGDWRVFCLCMEVHTVRPNTQPLLSGIGIAWRPSVIKRADKVLTITIRATTTIPNFSDIYNGTTATV